jgi:hypothetical protein
MLLKCTISDQYAGREIENLELPIAKHGDVIIEVIDSGALAMGFQHFKRYIHAVRLSEA